MSSPASGTLGPIAGAVIEPLDAETCERYLARLLGEAGQGAAGAPAGAPRFTWALAHCDDGVTWGRHHSDAGIWRLGSQAVPQVSPPIRRRSLQQLRIFGEAGEVLIWSDDGGFRGRLLRETDPPAGRSDEADPLRPYDESRILRGDHILTLCDHAFTHVADVAGTEQVLPLVVSRDDLRARRVRLSVSHYWQQDAGSGAVRVAASRLGQLGRQGGHHG